MFDINKLTAIERKELQLIWNRLTDYGQNKLTYNQFLEAGDEIITKSYEKGLKDGKDKT